MKQLRVDEVKLGDVVVLRDQHDNYIEGIVQYDGRDWFVDAFKTKVVFARNRQNGLGPRLVPTIKLAGHMSQLV